MGFFATYNGFIYNEFFAIPTDFWGSCYSDQVMVLSVKNQTGIPNDPKDYGYMRLSGDQPDNCVYPLGIDPRWFQSDQFLSYTNNFKMKIAVIFAIL